VAVAAVVAVAVPGWLAAAVVVVAAAVAAAVRPLPHHSAAAPSSPTGPLRDLGLSDENGTFVALNLRI